MFCNNEDFTVHFTSPEASFLEDMSFWISYDIMQPTDQIRYIFQKKEINVISE